MCATKNAASHVMDLIAPACTALDLDPLLDGLQLLSVSTLVDRQLATSSAPPAQASAVRPWAEVQQAGTYTLPRVPFPLLATRPALICRFENAELAAEAMATLLERYPMQHPVALVQVADGHAHTWNVPLFELAQQQLNEQTCAFLAPLSALEDVRGDGAAAVIARLLGPGGCPWDVAQTHRMLRSAILEETHEVLEAIDAGDMDALAEELGDLLLSVLAHSEMARQAGHFDFDDVREHVATKLIRRHPHVFGATVVSGTGEVLYNWEAIKQIERATKGQPVRTSALDGVPPSLPALSTGQKIIRKATKAGFDYNDASGVWAKFREEIDELTDAIEHEAHADDATRARRIEEEFGDLLLALTKLANWLHVDAESALREANAKFRCRFAQMEQLLSADNRDLQTMNIPDKEAFWRRAKSNER